MKFGLFAVLLASLLVFGCVSQTTPSATPTPEPSVEATATPTPTITPVAEQIVQESANVAPIAGSLVEELPELASAVKPPSDYYSVSEITSTSSVNLDEWSELSFATDDFLASLNRVLTAPRIVRKNWRGSARDVTGVTSELTVSQQSGPVLSIDMEAYPQDKAVLVPYDKVSFYFTSGLEAKLECQRDESGAVFGCQEIPAQPPSAKVCWGVDENEECADASSQDAERAWNLLQQNQLTEFVKVLAPEYEVSELLDVIDGGPESGYYFVTDGTKPCRKFEFALTPKGRELLSELGGQGLLDQFEADVCIDEEVHMPVSFHLKTHIAELSDETQYLETGQNIGANALFPQLLAFKVPREQCLKPGPAPDFQVTVGLGQCVLLPNNWRFIVTGIGKTGTAAGEHPDGDVPIGLELYSPNDVHQGGLNVYSGGGQSGFIHTIYFRDDVSPGAQTFKQTIVNADVKSAFIGLKPSESTLTLSVKGDDSASPAPGVSAGTLSSKFNTPYEFPETLDLIKNTDLNRCQKATGISWVTEGDCLLVGTRVAFVTSVQPSPDRNDAVVVWLYGLGLNDDPNGVPYTLIGTPSDANLARIRIPAWQLAYASSYVQTDAQIGLRAFADGNYPDSLPGLVELMAGKKLVAGFGQFIGAEYSVIPAPSGASGPYYRVLKPYFEGPAEGETGPLTPDMITEQGLQVEGEISPGILKRQYSNQYRLVPATGLKNLIAYVPPA